ncbi:hypothetical protein [Gloeobacter morelensis]|uniref:hypothetical protein n=1 Tax=Gloeobacter morelensis TaxID=2907343 RepID=UPI001E3462F9|nr:hypothetical protein [Gloeobacter morelensis]UFP97200.1 hypothetical protein ISF26_24065 [Gloeobacter morelensis MG652769]
MESKPTRTPPTLELAAEKLFLGVTEPLDAMVSLQLSRIVKSLIRIAYEMGRQDGARRPVCGSQCAAEATARGERNAA